MHEAFILTYVTVTGQPFHLSPKSFHQGQGEREEESRRAAPWGEKTFLEISSSCPHRCFYPELHHHLANPKGEGT